MRLGDMLDILKTFQVGRPFTPGSCSPGMSGWGDIVDVLEELADTNRPGHHHDRRWRVSRAGLNLESVDIAHVIRLGCEALIEAHTVVENQRNEARAETAIREAEAERHSVVSMAWEVY